MKTLKELVDDYREIQGWDACETDEHYWETFVDWFDVVETGEPDRHRWYTNYDTVWRVPSTEGDRFFKYYVMDVHGEDADSEDCGYEIPDLNDVTEVFPKTVSTTIYVTRDKL